MRGTAERARLTDERTFVLSPHLDDAVLSCWGLLDSNAATTVVNIFTASPPPGTTGWWDALTGAADSIERMCARREEDRSALALVGSRAIALEMLDAQYRVEDVHVADLVRRLRTSIPSSSSIYAPAALTGHPDHVLVRDAALELARHGWSVALYADLPHAIEQGWPQWVTEDFDSQRGVEVAATWREALTGAGLTPDLLRERVHRLDGEARHRKLRVVDIYASQRAALDEIGFAPLDDPRALGWEVSWTVDGPRARNNDGRCAGPTQN